MIVAVDIDGTVADYVNGFRDYIYRNHGIKLGYPTMYNLEKAWPELEGRYWDYHAQAVEDGLLLTLEPYPDAAMVLDVFRRDGTKIHFVTTRMEEDDTIDWLNMNNFIYDDISFGVPKISIGADVVIDDDPIALKEAYARGASVIAPRHPYNDEVNCYHFGTWKDLLIDVFTAREDT